MANDPRILQEAIEKATTPRYLSGKAEIVEHYRDTYGKGWKQTLVRDLSAVTGIKPKSLERRFDPSRLDVQPRTAKAKAEYQQLGQTLSPVGRDLKGKGITLTFSGVQNGRERTITHTMSGARAQMFVNDPSWAGWWDDYGDGLGESFEDEGSGEFSVYA